MFLGTGRDVGKSIAATAFCRILFHLVAGLVETFGLSICLDIGHLLVNGRDAAGHLDRWVERARVFPSMGFMPTGRTTSVSNTCLPECWRTCRIDYLSSLTGTHGW